MRPALKHALMGLALVCALALSACVTGPRVVDHAFEFDALVDSPGTEILAFRYGNGEYLATESGTSSQSRPVRPRSAINGPIPLGDTLYVKWRVRSTGEVLEETVDLKSRLPANMERQRVYFVVQARQLFVYLTDLTKPKPDETPIVGPFKVQSYVTRQLHPKLASQ